jgi:hypothetical protein
VHVQHLENIPYKAGGLPPLVWHTWHNAVHSAVPASQHHDQVLSELCAATGLIDSPRGKKKVNAFELLGSAMDISNLFEVFTCTLHWKLSPLTVINVRSAKQGSVSLHLHLTSADHLPIDYGVATSSPTAIPPHDIAHLS